LEEIWGSLWDAVLSHLSNSLCLVYTPCICASKQDQGTHQMTKTIKRVENKSERKINWKLMLNKAKTSGSLRGQLLIKILDCFQGTL